MKILIDWVKGFKAFFIALVVVFSCVIVYNVYTQISERFECMFSDCKKDMAKTISEQEGTIQFLKTQLQTSEEAYKELKASKEDNAAALKEFCQESKEISDRAASVIEKAKQASKAQQAKPKPETSLDKKETLVNGKDVIHEPVTVETWPDFTPEAIINGLWEMHCGGKHNVCKKDA